MATLDEDEPIIRELIAGLALGEVFFLASLLGAERWKKIGDGVAKRKYGNDFSRAVVLGRFPGVVRLELEGSNRDRPYQKIA